jgi:hypothetical protein
MSAAQGSEASDWLHLKIPIYMGYLPPGIPNMTRIVTDIEYQSFFFFWIA